MEMLLRLLRLLDQDRASLSPEVLAALRSVYDGSVNGGSSSGANGNSSSDASKRNEKAEKDVGAGKP
jgi:hypothetical protein